MKAALIVGGDYVGGIKQTLHRHGVEQVAHWSGRKPGDGKHVIPHDTQLVVILTDWISHALIGKVKRNAQKLGLKILYTKGNGGSLPPQLHTLGFAG